MRPSTFEKFLVHSAESGQPVMAWGPAGVGKSQITLAVAIALGGVVVDVRLSQEDPGSFAGIQYVAPDTGTLTQSNPWWNEKLWEIHRQGKRPVLFLDEITNAPPMVAAAAYQVVLDKRTGCHDLPPNTWVLAAGNRASDGGVYHKMPLPLANRFKHCEVEPNLDDFIEHGITVGLRPEIIAWLRFEPGCLHLPPDPKFMFPAYPTPRSIMEMSRDLDDNPSSLLEPHVIRGHIGPTGDKFLAFRRTADALFDITEILRDPKRAPTLDDTIKGRSARFALMGSLATTVTADEETAEQWAEPVGTYLMRLPSEFAMLFVTMARSMIRAKHKLEHPQDGPEWLLLTAAKSLGEWITKNHQAISGYYVQ